MPAVPLVSVVLATNRNGPFLAETVASVAAQTHPRCELVVVDDGAPDPDAIEAVAATVPGAVVVHQANAGVSVARNVGVARSSGTYLAFLDDDDTWDPERLARQVAAMEAAPHAVASYCQLDFIDEQGAVIGTGSLGPGDVHSILRSETLAPIPTLLVARAALERVGLFHPMLPPAEDLDLIYRLARTGPFVFVPDVLVHYRRHDGNESGDLRGAATASRLALLLQQRWSTRLGETRMLEDIRLGLLQNRRYWTDQMVRAAAHQARTGQRTEARRNAAFVAGHDPLNGLRALPRLGRRAVAALKDPAGS